MKITINQAKGTYSAVKAGQRVAVVEGPIEICDLGFGTDGGKLPDGQYPWRFVLDFAAKGERGLSLVWAADAVRARHSLTASQRAQREHHISDGE